MVLTFTGWKAVAFMVGFVGCTIGAMYPIIISPMIDSSQYQAMQREARKKMRPKEEIQPGNMKVWSDPFERKNE